MNVLRVSAFRIFPIDSERLEFESINSLVERNGSKTIESIKLRSQCSLSQFNSQIMCSNKISLSSNLSFYCYLSSVAGDGFLHHNINEIHSWNAKNTLEIVFRSNFRTVGCSFIHWKCYWPMAQSSARPYTLWATFFIFVSPYFLRANLLPISNP